MLLIFTITRQFPVMTPRIIKSLSVGVMCVNRTEYMGYLPGELQLRVIRWTRWTDDWTVQFEIGVETPSLTDMPIVEFRDVIPDEPVAEPDEPHIVE